MNIRVASLLFALGFVLISLPARAEDQAGGLPALEARVAALENNVAKLEGQITPADLVGTYSIGGIADRLGPLIPGAPPRSAIIGSAVFTGTLTLNVDGTGMISTTGNGSLLTQGLWTLTPSNLGNNGSDTLSWTYANGTVTVTFSDGSGFTASVGVGGRLLVVAQRDANTDGTRVDANLALFTRLQ